LQSVLGLKVSAPGTISAQPLSSDLGLGKITVTGLRYGGRQLDVAVDAAGTAHITAHAAAVPRQMSRESAIGLSV
jgi:hypothetical protein